MSRSLPLVSVVIPYHNEGDLLLQAVQSVRDQTYQGPMEVIVVDDAASVPVPVLEGPAGKLSVRVVRSDINLFSAGARNLGLKHATGEFVCFLDADDVYFPEKIEKQAAFLLEHAEACLAGGDGFIHRDGIQYYVPYLIRDCYSGKEHCWPGLLPEDAKCKICFQYLFHSPGFLCRTNALSDVGGFDAELRWGEEWDLQIRLAQAGRVGYIPGATYRYLCRPQSITSTPNARKQESAARISRKCRQSVPGLSAREKSALRKREQGESLLAAQVYLEEERNPHDGLRCALRALGLGFSVWAIRSFVRMCLHEMIQLSFSAPLRLCARLKASRRGAEAQREMHVS